MRVCCHHQGMSEAPAWLVPHKGPTRLTDMTAEEFIEAVVVARDDRLAEDEDVRRSALALVLALRAGRDDDADDALDELLGQGVDPELVEGFRDRPYDGEM